MTLPALSGMAAVSWPLMAALGPKWIPAADALKVLCLMGMSTVFACFTGPMLQALSRPHHVAALAWARTAVGTLFIVAAGFLARQVHESWQLMWIALARFATMTCLVTPGFPIRSNACDEGFVPRPGINCCASFFASIGTITGVLLLHLSGWFSGGAPVTLLIAEAIAGGAVGMTVLLSLDSQLRGVVSTLQQRILGSLALSRGV